MGINEQLLKKNKQTKTETQNPVTITENSTKGSCPVIWLICARNISTCSVTVNGLLIETSPYIRHRRTGIRNTKQ